MYLVSSCLAGVNCRYDGSNSANKYLTKNFIEGAEKTLGIIKAAGIKKAIPQSRSPSCGCELIYDGTFSGKLIEGNGLVAELLMKNGIEVYTENDLDKL